MGQVINKMYSLTAREVKSYNLERRAEKVISKEKPAPAPKHPSTVKELERLKEENVSTEYLHEKDKQLDGFLKKVYVTTPYPAPPSERRINPDRPLPQKRPTDMGITYGYSESEEMAVPEGKVTLKQAITFIANHQSDHKKYSSAAIASQYKLPLANTNDILEYFKMLKVKEYRKEKDPDSMSAYEKLQMKVKEMSISDYSDVRTEMTKVVVKEIEKVEDKEDAKPADVLGSSVTKEVEGTIREPKEKDTVVSKVQEKGDGKIDENFNRESSRKSSQENR